MSLGTGMMNTGTGQPTPVCPYCGMGHSSICPRVRAIEYHPDGSTKRVEFYNPQPDQDRILVRGIDGKHY